MSYCAKADIELEFGAPNVAKWANIGADDPVVPATIAARIAEAILVADEEIDEVLRVSPLKVPLTQADGTGVPRTIVRLARVIAGLWLYEGLGAVDYTRDGTPMHGHWWRRKWKDEYLDKIRTGTINVDALYGL